MSGYRGTDSARSAFTDSGFFRTGDQGRFDDDGYLFLTGRLKEFINKGGEKISPVELDDVIARAEGVGEVVCFAIDDETYGQDIGCAVTQKNGFEISADGIKHFVRNILAPHKVPKSVWVVESIPKTATGKVQRAAVAKAMVKQNRRSTSSKRRSHG